MSLYICRLFFQYRIEQCVLSIRESGSHIQKHPNAEEIVLNGARLTLKQLYSHIAFCWFFGGD